MANPGVARTHLSVGERKGGGGKEGKVEKRFSTRRERGERDVVREALGFLRFGLDARP